MNASRTHIIVLPTCQEPFADAAVNHKEHLRRHLRTQEAGLFHARNARVLPFREVLGCLDGLDGIRSLVVASLMML